MIYIIYTILTIILLLIDKNSKKPRIIIRWLIAFSYIIIIGIRGANVGVDTPVYYNHYYYYGQFGCDFVEPGFDWINRVCYALGCDSWVFFTVFAALTIIPVNITLCKLDRNKYFIAAMLFFLTTMSTLCNGMRQATVCGIFIWAAYNLFTHDSIKSVLLYCIIILLCTLIHASAVFLLFVVLLKYFSFKPSLYITLYLISFALLFVDISEYLPSIILGNRNYARYIEDMSIESASVLGFIFTTLQNVIIFFLMLKTNAFKKYTLIANLVFLSFALKNIGFNYPIIGRVTMYFSWFVYILLAFLHSEVKTTNPRNSTLSILVITLMYAVLCIHGYVSESNQLLPYTTFWENNNYTLFLDR